MCWREIFSYLDLIMTGTKRARLTADDLLRRQERPNAKKARVLPTTDSTEEGSASEVSENSLLDDRRDYNSEYDSEDESEDGNVEFSLSNAVQNRLRPSVPSANTKHFKPSDISFSSLGISAPLQAALSAMSIRTPTEVQAACIPPLLSGLHHRFCHTIPPHTSFSFTRQRLYRECQNGFR